MLRRILEMDSKRKTFLIYIAIIAVQLVVMLYWANEKSNFWIDEFHSMCYASRYTGEGDTARYITTSPEWKFNEWVNNGLFKKHLLVEEKEQIFSLPFFRAMQKLVTGRNYFGLLNIAESIAGYSFVSARPGIVLNLIIFIFVEIALLFFMRKMKMDVRSQYLALAMFGFSGHGIGLVEYIRFYILVVMYLLWMLTIYYAVWNSNSFKKIIPAELGILGLTYLAYKNSELIMIFFGACSFCFVIALVISKKWKPFISYIVMGLCGVAYIWEKTDFIDILLHPRDYSQQSSRAVGASLSIAEFSKDLTKTNVLNSMKFFVNSYFGGYLVVLMAAIVLTIYSLCIRRRKENNELSITQNMTGLDTLIAVAVWIGLLGLSFYIDRGVIICVGIVCILMLRFLYEMTGYKISLRNFKLSSESGFVCVLLGTAIIYTLVIAMADLVASRYFCFAFVLFSIVFWYILDRILTRCIRRELVFGWYIILAAFVALSALVPFKTRDIGFAYLYEDDRSFKSAVEPYRNMDVVLVAYVRQTNGTIYKGETYDCVNQMSENSNIYAIDLAEYSYDQVGFKDEFVLWGRNEQDISLILDDLAEHGYGVESLGQNHISQAYVCRINEKEH